jgi:hypothetical protein
MRRSFEPHAPDLTGDLILSKTSDHGMDLVIAICQRCKNLENIIMSQTFAFGIPDFSRTGMQTMTSCETSTAEMPLHIRKACSFMLRATSQDAAQMPLQKKNSYPQAVAGPELNV